MPWELTAVIAAGGAIGALGRYALALAIHHVPDGFPWATLLTNVSGCFLIGVLMVLVTEVAGRPHQLTRPFLGVGVLGGFTTFSTYTVESHQLFVGPRPWLGALYLLTTLVAALTAVQLGITSTRALTRGRG
jgi:CrcB protein